MDLFDKLKDKEYDEIILCEQNDIIHLLYKKFNRIYLRVVYPGYSRTYTHVNEMRSVINNLKTENCSFLKSLLRDDKIDEILN